MFDKVADENKLAPFLWPTVYMRQKGLLKPGRMCGLAVWRKGNALVFINEVNLR